MNPRTDKCEGALPGAPVHTEFLSLDRLRHRCARPDCPERGRLWPRWRGHAEEIEFDRKRYCCASCAEFAFEREIERHLLLMRQESERPHRIPLGLLLISRGQITSNQLREALLRQRERAGQHLGNVLREMEALSEAALTTALSVQWGCPVFPLENNQAYLECSHLLPSALLQSASVLPVHLSVASKALHLAFTRRIDHTLLYVIERMCGYRALPCVASERLVGEALNRIRCFARSHETVFDSVRQPQEMAHLAAGYAGKLRAAQVQLAGAAGHLWFRFENPLGTHHLLFQLPPEWQPAGASVR